MKNFEHIKYTYKHRKIVMRLAEKYFIENVDNNMKIAILYSTNQVFAVNQSKEKNLHNRYEGEYYYIDF